MKNLRWIFVMIVLISLVLVADPAMAQCPMCKASIESSIKSGSRVGVGLNQGILYLLAMPYLAFSIIFFMWYRSHKRNKAQQASTVS